MALRMTLEEYRAWQMRQKARETPTRAEITPNTQRPETPIPRRNKYGNQRVEVNGKTFDSIHEARVYEGLLLRVKAGELKTVLRQVGFDLPGGIRYFADFVAVGMDDKITVYDAKSEATKKNRVYINKKKQLRACCGLDIVEV